MINSIKEKDLRGTLMILLALMGLTALGAGFKFMEDISGKSLGFSTEYIRFSPFDSYFWPGFILFVCIGLYASFCFFLVSIQYRYYPVHVMVQGLLLIGWILIQIVMVRDFNLLHGICLVIGAILFFSGKVINS